MVLELAGGLFGQGDVRETATLQLANVTWIKLKDIAFSGVSSVSSGTFPAQDTLMIIIKESQDGSSGDISLQFNGDTGANYYYIEIATATWSQTTGATSIKIGRTGGTSNQTFVVLVGGKSRNETGKIAVQIGGINTTTTDMVLGGGWQNPGADITSVLAKTSAGNFTGTLQVFYLATGI